VLQAPASEKTPLWGGCEPKESAAVKGWRGLGSWQEDWGELNTSKASPALFVLDTGSCAVSRLAGMPADHSCGQPLWTPDGSGVVFVAWPHQAPNFPQTSRKLGIVFCFNRWARPGAAGGAGAVPPLCAAAGGCGWAQQLLSAARANS
jgi:acylaminoacyl-peptidase